jgi:hypothetical protein
MRDTDRPNRQSNMEKAEGDRADASRYEEEGHAGITNRPIAQEKENQERVPDRGERKGGTHAG